MRTTSNRYDSSATANDSLPFLREGTSYFKETPEYKISGLKTYRMRPEMLEADRAYMVYFHGQQCESVALMAFEYFCYPPQFAALNNLFQVTLEKIQNDIVVVASFPKNDLERFKKTADIFTQTIVGESKGRTFIPISGDPLFALEVPAHPSLFVLSQNAMSEEALTKNFEIKEAIPVFAQIQHNLGVD